MSPNAHLQQLLQQQLHQTDPGHQLKAVAPNLFKATHEFQSSPAAAAAAAAAPDGSRASELVAARAEAADINAAAAAGAMPSVVRCAERGHTPLRVCADGNEWDY